LTMSEEDGAEDKVIQKLLGEAVKNVFEHYFDAKSFKPLVEWFESGQTFPAGDRIASAEYVKRLANVPMLKKSAGELLTKSEAGDDPALLASATEFILEGLHVENRLNKNVKAGQTSYKR